MADEDEDNVPQARQRLAVLEERILAVTGVPQPFPDEVDPVFRPFEALVAIEAAADEVGFDIVQLDCSEYPCLLVAEMHPGVACRDASTRLYERGYPDASRCEMSAVERLVRVLGDPAVPFSDGRVRYRLREVKSTER